jgi:hypothetical protein
MTRLWLVVSAAALVIAAFALTYHRGYSNGSNDVRQAWRAAELAAQARASAARRDADASVPDVVEPDPALPAGAKPCRVRDHYDRDCG